LLIASRFGCYAVKRIEFEATVYRVERWKGDELNRRTSVMGVDRTGNEKRQIRPARICR